MEKASPHLGHAHLGAADEELELLLWEAATAAAADPVPAAAST